MPVHRLISIVQGGTLYNRYELRNFAQRAAAEKMELIAVPGSHLGWDTGRQAATDGGMRCEMNLRGSGELRKVIAVIIRKLIAADNLASAFPNRGRPIYAYR